MRAGKETGRQRASLPARSPLWHEMSGADVVDALKSDVVGGLSVAEATRRLLRSGPNSLSARDERSTARILLEQFFEPTVLVLAAAAILSALLGEGAESGAIAAILALNAALGFAQDFRAERAMQALKLLAVPRANVRRDGVWHQVASAEVVPGDIVALDAGNAIPADLRLLEAKTLTIDESILTGESVPAEKTTDPIAIEQLALGDQRNMAFSGTTVANGRAIGVVIATGMHTEMGHIAELVAGEAQARTPLQQRLAVFGRQVVIVVLLLCAVLFAAGMMFGEPAGRMFMTALSLAVAAIPEALPAVATVALALGARAMARHHALIRRLPAVETLGAVTVICADKTGTLTENRMQVETALAGAAFEELRLTDATQVAQWPMLVDGMALCNDVVHHADGALGGDPTEIALYSAAMPATHRNAESPTRTRVAELPFSSERGRMTTIHEEGDAFLVMTKGAPEQVADCCTTSAAETASVPFDRAAMLARAHRLAESGLRVIAFASKRVTELPAPVANVESGLTFDGLVGLLDPPRRAVRASIAECAAAGVRVVMITGDHPATALSIATRLGIAGEGSTVVTGVQLAAMTEAAVDACVRSVNVFARISPEDKVRILGALQRAGDYVAMTGDGVNDAPALRRADIGVAMGKGGTDVAREAADMVLLDDAFGTIVSAIREGRRVYDNVRRFVRYAFATNVGEISALVLAPLLGMPLPLLPIQILWMNLVTDGLPGVALMAEPAEHDVMRRPPRPHGETILARGLWQQALRVGALMAALSLGMQYYALTAGNPHWQTMTFTVLTFAQLANVLAIRSERRSLWSMGLRTNLPLLLAVIVSTAMHLAIVYLPAASRVFRTTALSAGELAACVAGALTILLAVELEKQFAARADNQALPDSALAPIRTA